MIVKRKRTKEQTMI